MKTLNHILQEGTDSEKELARLVLAYPTNPEAILHQHSQENVRSLLWGAGCAALSSYLTFQAPIFGILGVPIALVGGIAAIAAFDEVRKNRQVRKKLQQSDVKNAVLETDEAVFYMYPMPEMRFTCQPTLVETTLGTRVYPLEEPTIQAFPQHASYGFLGRARFEGLRYESYKVDEPVLGSEYPARHTATYTRAHVQINHHGKSYTLTDENSVHLPKMIASLREGDDVSLLLLRFEEKLSISEAYSDPHNTYAGFLPRKVQPYGGINNPDLDFFGRDARAFPHFE